MTINVFLDTEFTSLAESASLVSIGLITADGDRSFYVELSDTYTQEDCSDFVLQVVLPLLDARPITESVNYTQVYARMTLAETSLHLNNWFAALIDPVQVWSDAPNHDWRYVQQIFSTNGLPYNLLATPNAILGEDTSANARYHNTIEREYSQKTLRPHHALDDAKAMRLGWKILKN
jgi:3' exoribonuclease, RNase T-like